MNFAVFGGFEVYRKASGMGVFDKEFWERVKGVDAKLPEACGCYLFALKNGQNFKPWYVGKTEKRTFEKECFDSAKQNYYNEILTEHNGSALLFLIPRLTSKGKFSKPTKSEYRNVEQLETMLIALALEQNREIYNVRKTKLLREMVVPGVINSPKGPPTLPVRDLKNALGIA